MYAPSGWMFCARLLEQSCLGLTRQHAHADSALAVHYLSEGSMAKIRQRRDIEGQSVPELSLSADGTEDHLKAHHSVGRHRCRTRARIARDVTTSSFVQ